MATFFHDGDPGCTAENWNGCDPLGGCNSSEVSSFNPTNLNISSWVESFQALGATSAVLTAKHGCGFLGWKTNTTLPDGSPYRFHVRNNTVAVQQRVGSRLARSGAARAMHPHVGPRVSARVADLTKSSVLTHTLFLFLFNAPFQVPDHLDVIEQFVAHTEAAGIGKRTSGDKRGGGGARTRAVFLTLSACLHAPRGRVGV